MLHQPPLPSSNSPVCFINHFCLQTLHHQPPLPSSSNPACFIRHFYLHQTLQCVSSTTSAFIKFSSVFHYPPLHSNSAGGCGSTAFLSTFHQLGATWAHVHQLGETWAHVHQLGETWVHVHQLGETWAHVHQLGETWARVHQLGETWAHVYQLGETWVHVDRQLFAFGDFYRYSIIFSNLDISPCHASHLL